jgi:hypothetical protein
MFSGLGVHCCNARHPAPLPNRAGKRPSIPWLIASLGAEPCQGSRLQRDRAAATPAASSLRRLSPQANSVHGMKGAVWPLGGRGLVLLSPYSAALRPHGRRRVALDLSRPQQPVGQRKIDHGRQSLQHEVRYRDASFGRAELQPPHHVVRHVSNAQGDPAPRMPPTLPLGKARSRKPHLRAMGSQRLRPAAGSRTARLRGRASGGPLGPSLRRPRGGASSAPGPQAPPSTSIG